MECEGSIGLVTGKMKKKIADFHVLVLFMAKKHNLSDKKNSVCHAPLPFAYIFATPKASLKARKLKCWLPQSFGPTSILRILKFGILRVPPIQIPTKKGYTLSFVQQISP
jgi:hypothetical protein